MSLREILAANMRRLRSKHAWSQETLAERAGLHRTYVGDIERGARNVALRNIEKLAAALEFTVRELFTSYGIGERPSPRRQER